MRLKIIICIISLSLSIPFFVLMSNTKVKKSSGDSIVCCEIFGYGSKMKKCCFKYRWLSKSKCVVPKNFVGGGRRVVKDSFCKKINP